MKVEVGDGCRHLIRQHGWRSGDLDPHEVAVQLQPDDAARPDVARAAFRTCPVQSHCGGWERDEDVALHCDRHDDLTALATAAARTAAARTAGRRRSCPLGHERVMAASGVRAARRAGPSPRAGARIEAGVFPSRFAGAMLVHAYTHRVGAQAVLAEAAASAPAGPVYDNLGVLAAAQMAFSLGRVSVEQFKF
jgi:hypothetical protein